MTKLIPIVTDKKILENPSKKVSLEEGREIANVVKEQLSLRDNAVGLAACQIGIDAAVCAIKTKDGIQTFINPQIVSKQDEQVFLNEGCLSFPGKFIQTKRSMLVVVEDLEFPNGRMFENFAAVAISHEVDHTLGITMFENEIKPYDECFCGSGKKIKFCCLNKTKPY